MKTIKLLPILLILLISGCQQAINNADNASVNKETSSRGYVSTGTRKFPYTTTFTNIVKPSNKSQDQLNNDVKGFYEYWHNRYVKRATKIKDVVNGKTKYGYYVEADGTGDVPDSWGSVKAKSHSEANGYGMIITALMGDKETFDGLYIMYNNFRSTVDSDLMSWIIPENEDISLRDTSATDGDIDIAYALLLADIQWGSNGDYNYKAQSMVIIDAIKDSLFNHTTMRTTGGDAFSGGKTPKHDYLSRPSDWLVAEFRTFYDYTNDSFWTDAIDEIYNMIDEIILTESPKTHLMPDFVEHIPAKAADEYALEGEGDNDYFNNACRYPWRVGMGYGHYNDDRSRKALDGLVDWALKECNGDIYNFMRGYTLDGQPKATYSGTNFTSPLMLAASHDSKNQAFINDAFGKLIEQHDYNTFFGETITLQCLLYVTGNWWVPTEIDSEAPTTPTSVKGTYNSSTKKIKLTWNHSTDNVGVRIYVIQFDTLQVSKFVSGSENVFYQEIPVFDESKSYYDFRVKAVDDDGNESPLSSTVRVNISNSGPAIPNDPAATSRPSSFTLSKDNWNGSSTYKIIANMWWGQNATLIKLYENGTLIKTVNPSFATPAAQRVTFNFSGKAKGTYVYKIDAINQHGTTTSSNFTYTVTR